MASEREIAFAQYWEGKEGRKLTVDVVRDAYLAGWSDQPSCVAPEPSEYSTGAEFEHKKNSSFVPVQKTGTVLHPEPGTHEGRLRHALQSCIMIMQMCKRNCGQDELMRAYLKEGIHVAENALTPSPQPREVGK